MHFFSPDEIKQSQNDTSEVDEKSRKTKFISNRENPESKEVKPNVSEKINEKEQSKISLNKLSNTE